MTGLHATLAVLAARDSSAEDRKRASSVLIRYLETLRVQLAAKYPNKSTEVLDEAVDRVRQAAAVGTARYRGDDDRTANAWCWRICRNSITSEWRKEQARIRAEDTRQRAEAARRAREEQEAYEVALYDLVTPMAHEAVLRRSDGEEVFRDMSLGLAILFHGVSREQLLGERGYIERQDPSDPARYRKATQNLYQDTRRGRVELSRVVARLVAAGRISPEQASEYAKIAKLPWPPPSRASRPRKKVADA